MLFALVDKGQERLTFVSIDYVSNVNYITAPGVKRKHILSGDL